MCQHCSRFLLKIPTEAEKKLASALLHSSSINLLLSPHKQPLLNQNKPINQRIKITPFSAHQIIYRGVKSWSEENHYTVLGVDIEASQAQIRSAYLKQSKEFHPDHNIGASKKEIDEIHNKFVKINDAYSVLSNQRERKMYDLSILVRQDPRWREPEEVTNNSPHFRTQPMSFEERVRASGFPEQDPDFYKRQGYKTNPFIKYVIYFLIIGSIVQFLAIRFLYYKHIDTLNLAHERNTAMLMEAEENSRKYTFEQQMDRILFKKDVGPGRQVSPASNETKEKYEPSELLYLNMK